MDKEKLELLMATHFHSSFKLVERKENIFQLWAPLYYPDGDMIDIFIDINYGSDNIVVCDYGMTLMKLSYYYDVDTPNKKAVLEDILKQSGASFDNGNIYLKTTEKFLFTTIMALSQVIIRVSDLKLLQRTIVSNLFYENINEYIVGELKPFNPKQNVAPIENRKEIIVDYAFVPEGKKPVYLFTVKGNEKAQSAVISILFLQQEGISFTSAVVNDDFDSLPQKQRKFLMSAADKQFYDLKDFQETGYKYLARCLS